MALALSAVIAAPARVRPLVGATMAAFAIAVCYSILELGSHYPSDVLGGLFVAATWTLFGIAALWTVEAHRRRRDSILGVAAARTSAAAALAPFGLVVTGALLAIATIVVARPRARICRRAPRVYRRCGHDRCARADDGDRCDARTQALAVRRGARRLDEISTPRAGFLVRP